MFQTGKTARRALLGLALAGTLAVTQAGAEPRVLRVCASPDNLPFSNQREEGFENRIAQLIAEEMNASLSYTWHPQRRGFIRRTLKAGLCDLVMGVPSSFEMVLPTRPYYASSYVFVTAKDRHLGLRSFDDPVLRTLRIGLHAIGDDGANPPPAHALARRNITANIRGYTMWDVDAAENPQARIIDAVASGEIDVAIVWGPLAGYFAKNRDLLVEPVSPSIEPPNLPFVYAISMGVRHEDAALKREVDSILERRRDDIDRILEEYGLPRVQIPGRAGPS